jgi:5-methylcytosine-specific restriction protein A
LLCEKEGESLKPWAEKFYKSKAWQDCREAFFISKHGLCERCGRPGLIVHHRIYLTPQNINDPNITLSFENLELLCSSCHNNEHHSTDVTAEGLCFNEHGELVVDNPK